MSEQAKPSKLRVLMARVFLCLSGLLALYMGLAHGTRADATTAVIVFSIVEFVFGLYLLFVAFFRSGGKAVQMVASFMDPD